PGASWTIVRVALRGPAPAGVKTRRSEPLPPGATVWSGGAVGTKANSLALAPVTVILATFRRPLPPLLIVTVCAALGVPSGRVPKSRGPAGLISACGWTPVSPPASLDQAEAPIGFQARTR